MAYTIPLLEIAPVTHDTNRLVFEKPMGFEFVPGQAVEMTLDRDGWRDERRPFTMTSQPEDAHLEFVIKSYPDHDGVTARIPEMRPGDRVRIGAPWGAIHDAGPGVFVAGGAGLTPFISILRRRARDGALGGCHLVFSNKAEQDIILRAEWERAPDLRTSFVLDAPHETFPQGPLDAELLGRLVGDFSGLFYLCGPPPMEKAVRDALAAHGVGDDSIVSEDMPPKEERDALFES
jgi:hypothetical protein